MVIVRPVATVNTFFHAQIDHGEVCPVRKLRLSSVPCWASTTPLTDAIAIATISRHPLTPRLQRVSFPEERSSALGRPALSHCQIKGILACLLCKAPRQYQLQQTQPVQADPQTGSLVDSSPLVTGQHPQIVVNSLHPPLEADMSVWRRQGCISMNFAFAVQCGESTGTSCLLKMLI